MSFTSKVDIWNLALGHIRAKATVSDPDEATKEANACRLYYDHARRLTLAAHDWGFARQIKALSSIASPGTAFLREYAYAYNLPTDINTPRYLYPFSYPQTAFEIVLAEGVTNDLSLLTNASTAKLVYTADVETIMVFSENFVTALAWHLAAYVGPKITGNDKWYDISMKMYERTLPAAVSHEQQNYAKDQDRDPPDAPWITAR